MTLVDAVLAVEVVVDTSWEFGRWRYPFPVPPRPVLPADRVGPPTQ